MSSVLYLAWRYLLWHRWKTAILVGAVTLVMYLPLGLQTLIQQTATDMTARADNTPLLLGRRGSPLELVLNSLYFAPEHPQSLSYADFLTLRNESGILPVPLYVRFRSQGVPIVGTTLDYFDFRGLSIGAGRQMATLGEAVLGAEAARTLGVGPGDAILSSPESVFDIAGVYPLKMRVAGVLQASHGQDDRAIFVDLKTAWIIEGLGHGHQDLQSREAAGAVLKTEGERIVANASLVQYNEITPENIDSFHFHGERENLPLTAVLPVPADNKSGVLLLGRYQSDETLQMLEPAAVIDQLLATVFRVQRYVLAAMALVGVATAAVALLVLLLSWRARRNEQRTLFRLGGARAAILTLMLAEAGAVVLFAALATALLSWLTTRFGGALLQAIVL